MLNVLDYPDPTAALNDAKDGDTVYFPGVKVYQAPTNSWTINKSLQIVGDGPGKEGSYTGTVLTPFGPDKDVFVIDPQGLLPGVTIRDLRITRRQSELGTDGRDGIRFAPAGGKKLSGLRIERVAISHMKGVGIRLEGSDSGSGAIVGSYIFGCDISSCDSQGIRLKNAFQTFLGRCRLKSNGDEGILADSSSQVVLQACTFDSNKTRTSPPLAKAELTIDGCSLARVDACKFRNFGTLATKRAIYMDRCGGVGSVGACEFELPGPGVFTDSVGLEFASPVTDNGAILVLPNRFLNVDKAVRVNDFVVASTVFAQFSESAGAATALPTQAEDAPVAVPGLATSAGGVGLSGLLIPSLNVTPIESNPALNVQGGMLFLLNSVTPNKLRAFVGGGWKDVSTI